LEEGGSETEKERQGGGLREGGRRFFGVLGSRTERVVGELAAAADAEGWRVKEEAATGRGGVTRRKGRVSPRREISARRRYYYNPPEDYQYP